MDSYSREEIVTKTVVYSMPSGTNWAEFSKLFARVAMELQKLKGRDDIADDEIKVRSWDERIQLVFSVDVEKK